MNLEFTNREDAIIYCERMGYKYEVEDKKPTQIKPKSYGVNFSWNKKTRVSTK
jgi:NADH dehydrogenase (ubiquinone) Fe-S protein 4